jgi:8-oxo-dGTP diphosphatase
MCARISLMKPGFDYIGISTSFYCFDDEGNLLLQKRSSQSRDEQGRWDSGSGQLEFGQTPEENVLRELKEEYGCVGEIIGTLPTHSILRIQNDQDTHWLVVPFFVRVKREDVRNNYPLKIDEIGWFKLQSLPTPLHTGFQFTFEKYRNYFAKYE